MSDFELGIGDVANEREAAQLIAALLGQADGELAAGGQWGRAVVSDVVCGGGRARFLVVTTARSFDNDMNRTADAGKQRAFYVTVQASSVDLPIAEQATA